MYVQYLMVLESKRASFSVEFAGGGLSDSYRQTLRIFFGKTH
jgi:hypothetical protein